MTRIIKKSKKKRTAEEIEHVVEEEGKDLSQAGGWFQANKNIITWVLVAAFVLTCIGITSLTNCMANNQEQAQNHNNADTSSSLRDFEKEIAARKSNAGNGAEPEQLVSLGIAYKQGILELKAEDFKNRENKNAAKISEYTEGEIEAFNSALSGMTPDNSSYASVSGILANLYVEKGDYKKAIEIASKNEKIAPLLSAAPDKVAEIGDKLIDLGKSPDGFDMKDTSFIPLVSAFVTAKINLGEYKQVEKIAEFARKYNLTPEFYSVCARAMKDGGDLKGASECMEIAIRLLNNAGVSADDDIGIYTAAMQRACVYEEYADILLAQGKKEEAADMYDAAIYFYDNSGNKEKAEPLKEKRAKTGVPEKLKVVKQERMPDGSIKVIMSDGSEVVMPIDNKPEEEHDAASAAKSEGQSK